MCKQNCNKAKSTFSNLTTDTYTKQDKKANVTTLFMERINIIIELKSSTSIGV